MYFAKYWGLDEDNYKAAVDWIINRRLRKIDVGVVIILMERNILPAIS